MTHLFRRGFLKLTTSTMAGFGLSPLLPHAGTFENALQVRPFHDPKRVYTPGYGTLVVIM